MRIAFLGAARTVTGSQHLLTVNGHKILLDCGLYQGSSKEASERNSQFDFDPRELDAVILSHAHIDHSGMLPKLVKDGYEGPIYTTKVTAHLADIMLRDSGGIQESEAEEQNQKRNGNPARPLYTEAEAAKVAPRFKSVPYEQEFEVVPGTTARLVEAGHILGSAAVALEIEENGGKHRLWFSGDIGRRNLPLIRDPILPSDADTLIMECTYGDKSHDDPLQAVDELREVLVRTVERGGKVIISASGMAETGRIVHHIRRNIGDPRCTILIVSYQAPNTLGRALAEGEEQVMIFGEVYERKAEVATVSGLSAHAGQDFLFEYATAVKGRARQVFLVHGEDRPAEALQDKLQAAKMGKVYYSYLRQTMEI